MDDGQQLKKLFSASPTNRNRSTSEKNWCGAGKILEQNGEEKNLCDRHQLSDL